MNNYNIRPRFSEEDARTFLRDTKSPMIEHLVSNDDGTFSILAHIVCEWCDYCEEQDDCRGSYNAIALPSKPNPYEKVGR